MKCLSSANCGPLGKRENWHLNVGFPNLTVTSVRDCAGRSLRCERLLASDSGSTPTRQVTESPMLSSIDVGGFTPRAVWIDADALCGRGFADAASVLGVGVLVVQLVLAE